ncbi:hypothetical protein IFM46972_07963 [Aspergillus udagawae]|uniref:Uncharacterized protein n=1 Tax=Aspergillus udagawae TaxID=91492 RepID=A0A8H3P5T0_9EURO|nr:hypothetical protein IFM46972_07963 [Aspergillus udagawae]
MSHSKKARDRGQPSSEHGSFAPGPRELPELKIPDTINDDILRTMVLASEGVTTQSEAKLQDVKFVLESIMGAIEKMKNEKGRPEQDDAYNEIAAVYGLPGMTQQEKEISKIFQSRGRQDEDQMTGRLFSLSRETLVDTGNGEAWKMQSCFLNVLKTVNQKHLEKTTSIPSKLRCVLPLLLWHFH